MRHDDMAREVLLWQPDAKRRIGRLSLLYRVFPTYFIYWIAAYPVHNAIHPLNN